MMKLKGPLFWRESLKFKEDFSFSLTKVFVSKIANQWTVIKYMRTALIIVIDWPSHSPVPGKWMDVRGFSAGSNLGLISKSGLYC